MLLRTCNAHYTSSRHKKDSKSENTNMYEYFERDSLVNLQKLVVSISLPGWVPILEQLDAPGFPKRAKFSTLQIILYP